ncbi:spore germination protein [Paenibacillus thailandensis]|uniref:Spore germination protein n=1 Tax=Paenibacillus thailandensis TaxID=393250 RepID=A0ABW5QUE5_9BACL
MRLILGSRSNNRRSRTSSDYQNQPVPLSPNLDAQLAALKERLGASTDFVIHKIMETSDGSCRLAVCFISGLVDQQLVSQFIADANRIAKEMTVHGPLEPRKIKERLTIGGVSPVRDENKLLFQLLDGQIALLAHGSGEALAAAVAGGPRRAVEEPSSQTVIRGPKEGFTEDISTNTALVRRILTTPELRIVTYKIGRYTNTKVSLFYIEGIAKPEVVQEAKARLLSIDADSILESGYIEEYIQDGVRSPFPTMMNTERPDAVAGGLLEGMVAIMVDGTPYVLMAPVTFFRFLTSSEDYYQRYDISSFLRVIRLVAFFLALLLPSLFIAVTTFQQEMLPTTLLITLAAQREGTPLPTLMEGFLMELTFEVIREAGVRMPRAIGPAISIVGALVLGQAAVQAGLVSAAMVIVVSFTAICNFVLPAINMSAAVRLLRFLLMFLAGSFGLFGILAGLVPILAHLSALESFGVPYLAPIAPFTRSNLKDLIVRVPWWKMRTRPAMIGADNRMRQSERQESFAERAKKHRRDPLS